MDAKLKQVLNLRPHFNIADSIPLNSITDDGIAEIATGLYSKTYKIQDINYQIAKNEEKAAITRKWAGILKAIDPAYDFQIMIYNHTVDIEHLSGQVMLNEVGDGMDYLREDINRITARNITSGKNNIRRDIYITLTVPAADVAAAEITFVQAEHDIIAGLKAIPGCSGTALKSLERLNLLHDIFHGGEESEMSEYGSYNRRKVRSFSLKNLYQSGVTAVELIQPESLEYKSDHFRLGTAYGRAYNIEHYPTMVDDQLLRDFSTMPFNMLLTINLHQLDGGKAHDLVVRQNTNTSGILAEAEIEANHKGYSVQLVNPQIFTDYEASRELLDGLERRDQKLFEVKMHVVIFGKTLEELNQYCESFQTKCRTRNLLFTVSFGLQENAYLSSMPFGFDTTPKLRTLTTSQLSRLIPFSSQEMMMPNGTTYGINKVTHNLISFDRMMADSYGMIVLGFTGSGKSMFVKREAANTFLNSYYDADVIIIDPQGEYGRITRELGGSQITIRGFGDERINPMDISAEYGDNPVAEKVEFLQSFMTEILTYRPNSTQKSAISISASRCYENWVRTGKDEDIPTLQDFYESLLAYFQSSDKLPDIMDLLKSLELYTQGHINLFRDHTNVNMENSFISYNIHELGQSIRPLAMLVILDAILNRMSRNFKLGRPTFIYIDEIHLLFQKEDTAAWIHSMWKTARKFKGAPCGITQDTQDLLMSPVGQAVINNSAFVVLLNQSSINANNIASLLHLSARQIEFVTDATPGEGLLFIRNAKRFKGGVIPFEAQIPEDSRLYQICQTDTADEE